MTGIVVYHNSLRIHTHQQTGEVVTHLAFYAGWPNAFSALPVVKDVSRNARTRTSNGCRIAFANLTLLRNYTQSE